jgi:hypothetical protein
MSGAVAFALSFAGSFCCTAFWIAPLVDLEGVDRFETGVFLRSRVHVQNSTTSVSPAFSAAAAAREKLQNNSSNIKLEERDSIPTVRVRSGVCRDYQSMEWDGLNDPVWMTANNLQGISWLFGVIFLLQMAVGCCCIDSPKYYRLTTVSCWICTTLNALVLNCALKSDLCRNNPDLDLLGVMDLYESKCHFGPAAYMTITSIVAYFVIAIILFVGIWKYHYEPIQRQNQNKKISELFDESERGFEETNLLELL